MQSNPVLEDIWELCKTGEVAITNGRREWIRAGKKLVVLDKKTGRLIVSGSLHHLNPKDRHIAGAMFAVTRNRGSWTKTFSE